MSHHESRSATVAVAARNPIAIQQPDIDVEDLLKRVRRELKRNRGQDGFGDAAIGEPTTATQAHSRASAAGYVTDEYRGSNSRWHTRNSAANIHKAEQHALVGNVVPDMSRFKGVYRTAARLMARCVLYLSHFLTNQQRQFNTAIVAALRAHEEQLKECREQPALQEIPGVMRSLAGLKASVLAQERRLTLLLEEARRRLPEPFTVESLQKFADQDQHMLDALYLSLEDQFRGSREEIKQCLKEYLPLVEEAAIGSADMPIVDIGCGRGEWLELLRERGLHARGVDLNTVMIEECRQRGLEVIHGDLLAFLRSLPDTTVGAVTGFHLVEHLSLEVLVKLLDETGRVLKPGGVAIFETPNPSNIMVGAYQFHFDPTHQHPIPSPVLKFLVEARGLCRVEVLELHPFPQSLHVEEALSDVGERFNQIFFGPQDYAVVGRKA